MKRTEIELLLTQTLTLRVNKTMIRFVYVFFLYKIMSISRYKPSKYFAAFYCVGSCLRNLYKHMIWTNKFVRAYKGCWNRKHPFGNLWIDCCSVSKSDTFDRKQSFPVFLYSQILQRYVCPNAMNA